jgi:hypothetical protein
MAEYMLERYRKRRAYAIEKLGGKCVACDNTEALQFHHKDPSTKLFTLAKLSSVAWDRFIAELGKCELRCAECHKKVHPPTHGLTMYSHYRCRCSICKTAWSAYHKKYTSVA